MDRRWALVAFGVALVTAAFLAFAPLGSYESCTVTSSGGSSCSSGHESLLRHEGSSVLVVLAIPVVLTALVVIAGSRRVALAVAVLLSAFMVLAMLSIGVFLAPTVLAVWIAYGRSASASSVAK